MLVCTTAGARAGDECASDRVAYLLTRALAYDDNLKARVGGQLNIAILYRAEIAGSERLASTMSEAFTTLSGAAIQGVPMRVRPLAFEDVASLVRAVVTQRIGGIFVRDELALDAAGIGKICRDRKVIMLTCSEQLVRHGAALGVVQGGNKGALLVNLPASRAQGAAFGSDLLRVARVLR